MEHGHGSHKTLGPSLHVLDENQWRCATTLLVGQRRQKKKAHVKTNKSTTTAEMFLSLLRSGVFSHQLCLNDSQSEEKEEEKGTKNISFGLQRTVNLFLCAGRESVVELFSGRWARSGGCYDNNCNNPIGPKGKGKAQRWWWWYEREWWGIKGKRGGPSMSFRLSETKLNSNTHTHTHTQVNNSHGPRQASSRAPFFFFFFYLDTNGRMGPSDRPLKSPDPIQTLPRVTFISSIIFHRHSNKKKKKKKGEREKDKLM